MGETSVLDVVALLLWLELLDGIEFFACCWACSVGFGIPFDSFVDSAIGSAADEANNVVFLVDLGLGGIAVSWLSMLKTISEAIECDVTSLLVLLRHGEASHEA